MSNSTDAGVLFPVRISVRLPKQEDFFNAGAIDALPQSGYA